MVNTTVSGNRQNNVTSTAGGGVYNNSSGDTFIDSSTITNNEGEIAGNIGVNSSGSVFLINTIVGESIDSPSCFINSSGDIVSEGYNIDQGTSCGFNSIGDKSNTNPLLGPLQNNGGPTDTHLLLNGSPAVDMGNIDCPPPATDQRGVGRPIDDRCDIGAVEVNPIPIPTLSGWGLIAMAGILGIIGFIVMRRRAIIA